MQISKSKRKVIYLYACTFIGMGIGVHVSRMNTHFLEPKAYGDVRYINNIIAFFSGILLAGYFVSGNRLHVVALDDHERRQIKADVNISSEKEKHRQIAHHRCRGNILEARDYLLGK